MDAISKPLISGHLQRKKNLQIYYRISVTSVYLSHSTSSSHCYFVFHIYCISLLLTKLSMLIIPISPSLIFKQHTFLSILFGLLSQMNFQITSFTTFFQFQIPFEVACVIDNITYTMLYLRSIFLM